MDWAYNHHYGQLERSNSKWSWFTFQRTVECVFNNRNSWLGEMIKPREIKPDMNVRWGYVFQSDISFTFVERLKNYRHQSNKFRRQQILFTVVSWLQVGKLSVDNAVLSFNWLTCRAHLTVTSVLSAHGFTMSQLDNCVFYKSNCVICVHVDDFLVAAAISHEIDQVQRALEN